MWLMHPHVSPSMWLSAKAAPSRRGCGRVDEQTTPTGKKEASIVPGSSCTLSSAGWSPRNYLHNNANSALADHGAIVSAFIPPLSFCAPLTHTHTCVNLSYLLRAAHNTQLQETISRNPTVSYAFGLLIGWAETRGSFWNRQWWVRDPIRFGDEREEGGMTEMRRSWASKGWDIQTLFLICVVSVFVTATWLKLNVCGFTTSY